jgi:hypothetical protein
MVLFLVLPKGPDTVIFIFYKIIIPLTPIAEGSGDEGEKSPEFGAPPRASRERSGGAKPPKMGFCSGGTRGAKKWQKMAFLGQKRAKNDDF